MLSKPVKVEPKVFLPEELTRIMAQLWRAVKFEVFFCEVG
jgi:hypothetical protein